MMEGTLVDFSDLVWFCLGLGKREEASKHLAGRAFLIEHRRGGYLRRRRERGGHYWQGGGQIFLFRAEVPTKKLLGPEAVLWGGGLPHEKMAVPEEEGKGTRSGFQAFKG